MPFFLQNSFLAILMLTSRKPVKRRRIDEKMRVFFCYSPAVIKGLNKVTNICFKLAFIHVKQSNLPNSATSRKPVKRRRIDEKMRAFCYSPAVIKELNKVTNICFKLAFIHVKQSNLPNSARNRFAT